MRATFWKSSAVVYALAGAALVSMLTAGVASADLRTAAVAWEATTEVDAGQAHQGPWRMNRSQFLYVDDPTVAINDAGLAGVAWVDNATRDVIFQVFTSAGDRRFDAPVNVSRSPDVFSWLPRVVISDGDAREVAVLWQEIIFSGGSHGGDILFSRSTDGGQTFSDPVNLSSTTAGAGKGRLSAQYWHNGSLDLVAGAGGSLYAAWTEYEGALWVSRSMDGGRRFSEPLRVAGDTRRPARAPSLAVDSENNVYLAWTVGEDAAADIHFARSVDQGESFGPPHRIIESSGHADAPKLALDSRGVVHLTYGESADGPWQRYRIHYARSEDGGATFSTPRVIVDPGVDPGAQHFASANFPHLGLDGSDNLYVVWDLFPRGQQRSAGLGISFSGDNGHTFASPGVIPGTVVEPHRGVNGSLQGLLMRKLSVNASGDIAVVNSTFKPGEGSRVRLYRGRIDE
jgi:hypothetical protein